MSNQSFEPTEEPVTIDDRIIEALEGTDTFALEGGKSEYMDRIKQAFADAGYVKPLPEQPEAEKKQKYIIEITYLDEYALYDELHLTPRQAKLVADAVKELLAFIQGKEKFSNTTAELMVKARNAMKDSE